MKTPEILIVGAGPGGLAAAMLLANAGAKVRIVERKDRVGGRTSAIEAEGFRFDLGPTFFLYPRVLDEIFQAVGRNLFSEVPMKKLDPQYRLIFGSGGELNATPNFEQMEREVTQLSPQDAGAFRRFMDENRTKLERFRPILESPFNGVRDLLNPELLKAARHVKPWRSLGTELQKFFTDPRLVIAFSFQSKYLGMSPFRCPSLFSILSYLEYEFGVFHPMGGCSAVTERMAEICRELGVEIHLDEPVEQVLFEGRTAVGVRTTKANYLADSLVVNADFAHAMQKLVPNRLRRRWTDEKIDRKQFSCSTFMMYLGVDGLDTDVAHHSIYIAKDYQRNLREIEQTHMLSEDPSIYVQNAGVTDPSLAPDGQSTLYVLAPVTNRHPNVDWSREREPFRRRVLQQLEKVGIRDIESRIRYERVITPADWEHDFAIHRGATFNLAHNLGQMLHNRPRNRFEDLQNVYLVGGGTHPGSGLPVIFESARITSKLMGDDLGLDLPEPELPITPEQPDQHMETALV
ncbi:phytoene desaturase family protein [Thalassoroseus pseudoceratinae]|uniref:phytoene desaturase family protein n=1 Tax=Thalassoroseus pseudoceratinae TaxID=2713176 RepID=UPI001421A968|nr:phytoene desaturase family protein [Thalassoroseus pseudoceratinae]